MTAAGGAPPKEWNYSQLCVCLVISVVLQLIILPEMSRRGDINGSRKYLHGLSYRPKACQVLSLLQACTNS